MLLVTRGRDVVVMYLVGTITNACDVSECMGVLVTDFGNSGKVPSAL